VFTQNSVYHALKKVYDSFISGSSSSSSGSGPSPFMRLPDCMSLMTLSPTTTQKEFSDEIRKVISWSTIQRHTPVASESTFGNKSLEWLQIESVAKVPFFPLFLVFRHFTLCV
jgi:hypothetical protein